MGRAALETAILWIHALAGASWAGACGCFVIAASAAGAHSEERRSLARRAAPAVNRIGGIAVIVVLITGVANLFIAGEARRYQFSPQFIMVLCAKAVIFSLMLVLERTSIRMGYALQDADDAQLSRALLINGAIAAGGGIAMLLGLWLMGS
jgi:putative copper export protein